MRVCHYHSLALRLCLLDLLERLDRLCALRVNLEHILERSHRFVDLRECLVDATQTEMGIHVRVVQIDSRLVVLNRLLILAQVVISTGKVEMTLRRRIID